MSNEFSLALKLAQNLISIERSKAEAVDQTLESIDVNFVDKPVTRDMIAKNVEKVMSLYPEWRDSIDSSRLIRELETRFGVWIGNETFLIGRDDHKDWLNSERKKDWNLWDRYEQFLEGEMAETSVRGVDKFTDTILSLLEDPKRVGPWDRRGLVVGHVQSGKTSNYIGLTCKAADAGYKLIVVLAGLHKNLRSQTQMRLDEGFLGFESMPMTTAQRNGLKPIGVGLINVDRSIRPDTITNRSDNGDFNRRVADTFNISPGGIPLLFVVKKNASVLRNLLDWVRRSANGHDPETGRPIVKNVPLLVIDDEADHGSVDTKEQDFDENGQPDPDHDPTKINSYIRQLLYSVEQSAYIGYTATPFANIFIHDQGRTVEEGEDLFPRSFIVNLAAPSNYCGPVRIFGLDPSVDGENLSRPLPLVRHITDHAVSLDLGERQGWMPPKHQNGHRPLINGEDEIPNTLREAIYAFILSCASRKARGQERKHNTMLVHVTRFTSTQHYVYLQVNEELENIKRRLLRGEGSLENTVLASLRELWYEDFIPTSRDVRAEIVDDYELTEITWEEVESHLINVVSDIKVKEINGTAGDILDYDAHKETGLSVITIGGDKLARGLTLQGLSVSYFLRASRMYDTLMQMGRWFGYRPGYTDLCRLYMTPDLDEWFQHITEASEELKQEFDHMAAIGETPREYGLKVQSHPSLLITSRVKMRHGTEIQLAFARSISETVVFHTDSEITRRNHATTDSWLQRLGVPHIQNPELDRPENKKQKWKSTYLWRDVPATEIKSYLDAMVTHESAVKVNSRLLCEYIEKQEEVGELTEWTVALISGGTGGSSSLANLDIELIKRERSSRIVKTDFSKYVIRRLLAPRDEAIDLDLQQYQNALEETCREWHRDPGRSKRKTQPDIPSGPSMRRQRDCKKGLLLIYPLASEIDSDLPLIGFGVSFPHSDTARKVTYKVNNIYWVQEYAGIK